MSYTAAACTECGGPQYMRPRMKPTPSDNLDLYMSAKEMSTIEWVPICIQCQHTEVEELKGEVAQLKCEIERLVHTQSVLIKNLQQYGEYLG